MYSVPEKKEHTQYALDTASRLLQFYNTVFDIDYPLRKLGERRDRNTQTDTISSTDEHLLHVVVK